MCRFIFNSLLGMDSDESERLLAYFIRLAGPRPYFISTSLAGLADILASWTRCRALPLSVFDDHFLKSYRPKVEPPSHSQAACYNAQQAAWLALPPPLT